MVRIERVGYTAVGRKDEDQLPTACRAFHRFVADPEGFESGQDHSGECWWHKVGFLDLISKLNVEAYDPAYFEAMELLESLETGELRRLEDICLNPAVQAGTGSRSYVDKGVPLVKTADVVKRRRVGKNTKANAARIGFIHWEDIEDHVTEESWKNQNTKQLKVGDVLVQCVAHSPEYIGDKMALVDELPDEGKALALNKFLIIRPDTDESAAEYLIQFLASKFGRLQMSRYIRGMTAQIYEQDVRDFLIYVPPHEIQEKYKESFEEITQKILNTEEQYGELLEELDKFTIRT